MRGDELEVVRAFCTWLKHDGWSVHTEVDDIDVVAERGGERLHGEAKGETSAPGLDVNTAWGQLLSRMPAEDDPSLRYALIVRDEPRSVRAVLRAPAWVRTRLRVTLYAVATDGAVRVLGD